MTHDKPKPAKPDESFRSMRERVRMTVPRLVERTQRAGRQIAGVAPAAAREAFVTGDWPAQDGGPASGPIPSAR